MYTLNRNNVIIITFWTSIVFTAVLSDDGFYTMSLSPPGQKVSINGNITIRCLVDVSRTGTASTTWFRRQGDVRLRIGTLIMPNSDFDTGLRYSLGRGSQTATSIEFLLMIKNLQYQDSATIECGSASSSNRGSVSIAICDYPSSPSCDCMVQTGWPSPDCFSYLVGAQTNSDDYQRAIIGIVICLVGMATVAMLLTVYVHKDCAKKRKQRMEEKVAANEAMQATKVLVPAPLGPPGPSAMKHAATSTVSIAGQNVHFIEEKDRQNHGRGIEPAVSGRAVNQKPGRYDPPPQLQDGYPTSRDSAYADDTQYDSQSVVAANRSYSVNSRDSLVPSSQPGSSKCAAPQPPPHLPSGNAAYQFQGPNTKAASKGGVFVDPGSTEI